MDSHISPKNQMDDSSPKHQATLFKFFRPVVSSLSQKQNDPPSNGTCAKRSQDAPTPTSVPDPKRRRIEAKSGRRKRLHSLLVTEEGEEEEEEDRAVEQGSMREGEEVAAVEGTASAGDTEATFSLAEAPARVSTSQTPAMESSPTSSPLLRRRLHKPGGAESLNAPPKLNAALPPAAKLQSSQSPKRQVSASDGADAGDADNSPSAAAKTSSAEAKTSSAEAKTSSAEAVSVNRQTKLGKKDGVFKAGGPMEKGTRVGESSRKKKASIDARASLSQDGMAAAGESEKREVLYKDTDEQEVLALDQFGECGSEVESLSTTETGEYGANPESIAECDQIIQNLMKAASNTVDEQSFAMALIDTMKSEGMSDAYDGEKNGDKIELEKKINHFMNQVPIAQGPDSAYWRAFVDAYYNNCDHFCFPSWINPELIRDQHGRSAEDESFDISRIKAETNIKAKSPKDDKMHFTPALVQYWTVKKDHFDKIIFMKLGKFYEIFYTDACITQPICDLRWMGNDEKAHVGFPESSLHSYAQKIVDAGFSVTVVEQMETPSEMQARARSSVGKDASAKPKAVKREICEIYSQGTIAHSDMIGPEPSFLCSLVFRSQIDQDEFEEDFDDAESLFKLRNKDGSFSFVLVDVASSRIFYGSLADEAPTRPALRSFLAHSSPREILLSRHRVPEKIQLILQSMPSKPQVTYASIESHFSSAMVMTCLRNHFNPIAGIESPESVTQSKEAVLVDAQNHHTLATALVTCFDYLQTLLLRQKVLGFSTITPWSLYDRKRNLILDSAVMRSLEILESRSGAKEDTLFFHMNQCCTAFGTRLLRQWLAAPLATATDINRRLESVIWIKDHSDLLTQLRGLLKTLPDLERLSAKARARSLQGERGAVFFVDTAQKKIQSFLDLTRSILDMEAISAKFVKAVEEFDSEVGDDGEEKSSTRLHELLLPQSSAKGLFPDLGPIVKSITDQVVKTADGQYKPRQGCFVDFDEADEKVKDLESQLVDFLANELWDFLDIPAVEEAKYVHSKFRYEVEVSDKVWRSIAKKKIPGTEMSSTRSGFTRFQTTEIRKMTQDLEHCEVMRDNQLFPFMQKLFRDFYDASDHFSAAINILAEADVLMAFAFLAETWAYGPMCRPELSESCLCIKEGVHPVLCKSVGHFMANDIELGTESEPCKTIILTGPNMGGKSTLSRQVALLVIMAQVGCLVPAASMSFEPMDRIFTRIGAYDAILEGKSTFYVELDEVNSFVQQATRRSLGVIDEFGRGTSTEEGCALAYATVKYVAETLKCYCLFSTHFQEAMSRWLSVKRSVDGASGIAFYHMAADLDREMRKLVFLYEVRKGICPESHGLYVAEVAGVPASVMQYAWNQWKRMEEKT